MRTENCKPLEERLPAPEKGKEKEKEEGNRQMKCEGTTDAKGRLSPSVLRVHPVEQLQKLLGLCSARFQLSLRGQTCFSALPRLEA